MTPLLPVPRLLVSVRDAREARATAAGGADIIDFKEPARGPLGRADFGVVTAAVDAIQQNVVPPQMHFSVALGEVREVDGWVAACDKHLPEEVTWLKLGLAGLGRSGSAPWIQEWMNARRAIEQRLSHPVRWVAVAYADVGADAPAIDQVVDAAAATGCAAVLIDTYDKAGGRLLDCLDPSELARIRQTVHDREMLLALAGRLRGSDLFALQGVGADIIAVRSAVCAGDDRQTAVDLDRVRALQVQIQKQSAAGEADSTSSAAGATGA